MMVIAGLLAGAGWCCCVLMTGWAAWQRYPPAYRSRSAGCGRWVWAGPFPRFLLSLVAFSGGFVLASFFQGKEFAFRGVRHPRLAQVFFLPHAVVNALRPGAPWWGGGQWLLAVPVMLAILAGTAAAVSAGGWLYARAVLFFRFRGFSTSAAFVPFRRQFQANVHAPPPETLPDSYDPDAVAGYARYRLKLRPDPGCVARYYLPARAGRQFEAMACRSMAASVIFAAVAGVASGVALGAWIALSTPSPALVYGAASLGLIAVWLEWQFWRLGNVIPGVWRSLNVRIITAKTARLARNGDPVLGRVPELELIPAPSSALSIAQPTQAELRARFGGPRPCQRCKGTGQVSETYESKPAVYSYERYSYMGGEGMATVKIADAEYSTRLVTCGRCRGRTTVLPTDSQLRREWRSRVRQAQPVISKYNKRRPRLVPLIELHNRLVPWRLEMLARWALQDQPVSGPFALFWSKTGRN
jgi:hypothetical protein